MKTGVGSVLLACFAIPCSMLAQSGPDNDPDAAPGFTNSVFHQGQVDSINLYNGQLTIPVPVGPSYPVGPKLKFQAVLTYNSRVDDWGNPYTQQADFSYKVLAGDPALGIGWTFSLGAIKTCSQGRDAGLCYYGADGSAHLFQIPLGGYAKSNDASQFVLHDINTTGIGGPYEMWDGDGNHYLFGQNVTGYDDVKTTSPGYIHDFGTGRNGWYLTRVNDPFNNLNFYSVIYRPTADTPRWSYQDAGCSGPLNQTHMLPPAGSGSWIPQSVNLPTGTITIGVTTVQTVTGPMIGSLTFPVLVNNVSTQATWTLQYGATGSVTELCDSHPTSTTANVPLITAIQLPSDLPGSPSYLFSSYGACVPGLLSHVKLPTGATIDYQYGQYSFYHGRVGATAAGCQREPDGSSVIETTASACPNFGNQPATPAPNFSGGCTGTNEDQWLDHQYGVVLRKESVPHSDGNGGTVSVTGTTKYIQYAFPFGEQGTSTNKKGSQTLTVAVFPAEVDGRQRAKGVLFWGGPRSQLSAYVGDRTGADVEERVFDSDPNPSLNQGIPMPACGGTSPQTFCPNNAVRVTQRVYDYDDTTTETGNRRLLSETSYHQATQADGTCAPVCVKHLVAFSPSSTWEANGRHYTTETHSGNLGNDTRTITTTWTPSNWVTPNGQTVLPNLFNQRVESDPSSSVNRYFEFNGSNGFLNCTFLHDAARQRVFFNRRYPNGWNALPGVYGERHRFSEPPIHRTVHGVVSDAAFAR